MKRVDLASTASANFEVRSDDADIVRVINDTVCLYSSTYTAMAANVPYLAYKVC